MSEKRKTNGHSKPEDFLLPTFEDVTLPSGLTARLRPPTLDYYIRYRSALPARLLAAAKGIEPEPITPEEVEAINHSLIAYLFIEPRFSCSGEPGTFHPGQLKLIDRQFLDRWVMKYLDAGGGGAGLESFRAEPAGSGAAGAGSEAVRKEPELV